MSEVDKIAFTDLPLVYVAGPYAHLDPVRNTHATIHAAEGLLESGLVTPYVPHLTLLWHLVAPHDEEHWYAYDLAVLARCDALVRLVGSSKGADREVQFAHDRGIPVFYRDDALLDWARAR